MQKRTAAVFVLLMLLNMAMAMTPFGKRIGNRMICVFSPGLALHGAMTRHDTSEMAYCLRQGANVNAGGGAYAGRTPLMVAAIHGDADIARFLLSHGADPNLIDAKGLTALQLARKQNHPKVARLLVDAGAVR